MINDIETLRRALKRGDYCGIVLYEGPSRIDGAPIVAIACRITEASGNAKTGAMVQTFIMRQDIAPHEALKTGDDSSVCGDCPLRPIHKGATRCYVRVYQAPLSVWNAYNRGRRMENRNAPRKKSHGVYTPMAQTNRRGIERPMYGERGLRV